MGLSLLSFKFISALMGLVVPGYAIAKVLRLRIPLFAAFPLSALIICHSVTALTLFDGKITFAAMATILATVTTMCGLALRLRKAPKEPPLPRENGTEESSPWGKPALAAAGLLLLATAFRTTLYPLGGFDTFTRWDALAREMLRYGSLSFYPPITGSDFAIYTMPDGFPPLVASVYWWLYAATGTTFPQLTAVSVTLQLASILGLAWSAAETAFGKKAAAFTLLALTASPLLSHSVEIGQESGFLTLAVAGQLCFALAAVRRPSMAPVLAGALFAALGALAREYGPALALPGLFILLSDSGTRRYAGKYALLAAALASPWYIRNWLVAGSPLYPAFLPGSPRTNELLAALMTYYGELFGLSRFGAKEWLGLGYELIIGGSIALLAALPHLARNSRKYFPYLLSLAAILFLWLWSVGKTSGGVLYSLRVLAPAVVILALVAGKAFNDLSHAQGWLKRLTWLAIPAALWGIFSALSFPQSPLQTPSAILSTKGEAPEFCEAIRAFAQRINGSVAPATGILTDSPNLAVILSRETRLKPAIIWSSEAGSILSRGKGSGETARLLKDRGISMVALNRTSIHNDFLFRSPFYRDGVREWQEVAASGDWVLFAIGPETAP